MVLPTVFSMTWYKMVMQLFLVRIPWNIPLAPCIFLGIHTRLKARVYTKKIQVTRGIFHGKKLESVA